MVGLCPVFQALLCVVLVNNFSDVQNIPVVLHFDLPIEIKEAAIHERLSFIPLRSCTSCSEVRWFFDLTSSPLFTLSLNEGNELILEFFADSFFVHDESFQ